MRPADVVIDDLGNPTLPPAVTELMGSVAPMAGGLPFSPSALMDQASADTGLPIAAATGRPRLAAVRVTAAAV